MARGRPLKPALVKRVLEEINAGDTSRAAIARKYGISPASVKRIADDNGCDVSAERARTENATRARFADMARRRAEFAELLLERATQLDNRAWEKHQQWLSTQQGPELVELDRPPLRDAREAYTAVGIVLDKHLKLIAHDTNTGTDESSMLTDLAKRIGDAWRSGSE